MTKHTESIEVVVKDQRRRRWSLAEKAAAGASNLRTRHERVIGRSAGRRFGWTAVSVAQARTPRCFDRRLRWRDRKSTRLNSSHLVISYAVFCLKKKCF